MRIPIAIDGPTHRTRRMRFVVLAAFVSMLPLAVWWRQFRRLFFFGDDWQLLLDASTHTLTAWLLQPYSGEGILPLYKLIWIAAVKFTGGSYLTILALQWLTHFIILLLFGRLLLRLGFGAPASATAVATLGLAWSNMETLAWAMQWSALLAVLFLLIAWHLLLGILGGRRWLVYYVLCLLASGLVSTRGIFYGAVLAAFLSFGDAKQKWQLIGWSLLPSALVTAATLLAKESGAANLASVASVASLLHLTSFAVQILLLNPLYDLISYPGRYMGTVAVMLFGAAKIAVVIWAFPGAKDTAKDTRMRELLWTLLAFDVLNALATGYGRASTGDSATVSSRYQYVSLLCFGPFLGAAIASLRKEVAVIMIFVWLGAISYPWKRHLDVWTTQRGTDIRAAIETGSPNARFDPSPLTVQQARELVERYHLH
jgi:hypothetical protein